MVVIGWVALSFVRSGGLPSELPVPTTTPIWVTTPPDVPTPHEFGSSQEVIDYVLAMLEITEPPVEAYAARMYERDFALLQGGPGSQIVTPSPTIETDPLFQATPALGELVWVVGIRTATALPHWKLPELMGIPSDVVEDGEGNEFAVAVDDIGNVLQGHFLDTEFADGRREHTAPWHLADILRATSSTP